MSWQLFQDIIEKRRGRHSLAFALGGAELLVHQILAIYVFGWDFGMQYMIIYLAVLVFFNPHWRWKVQFLWK